MKRLLTYLKWLAAVLGVVVVVSLVVLSLYIRTEHFRELLREQILIAVDSAFPADVTVGKIEGSVWNDLIITDVTVRYQGRQIVQVARVTADYSLVSLLKGQLALSQIDVFEPTIRLTQDQQGNWDLLEAFASEERKEEEEGLALAVLLDSLNLHKGQVEITLAGDRERLYQLADMQLDGQLAILPSGIEAELRRLAMRIDGPELPPLQTEISIAYRDTSGESTVEIKGLRLVTQESLISGNGKLRNFENPRMEATLVIDKLSAADLAQIVSGSPLKQDLSGKIALNGPLADLNAVMVLSATDARVAANIEADLSGEKPQFEANVDLTQIDLQKLLAIGELAGIVDGKIQASGEMTSLATIQAQADVDIEGLQIADWRVGTATVQGKLAKETLKLTGDLKGGLGQAQWDGQLGLAGVPSYELSMSVQHLDVKKVAASEETVAGDLNLVVTVNGKGVALAEMNTQANVELRPSTVGPVAIQQGRLDVTIANGRIRIAQGRLSAQDTSVSVGGEVGIAPDAPGRLSYDLRVGHLTPWLALIEKRGSGTVTLSGQAEGSLSNLQLRGQLHARALHLEETSVQGAAVAFKLNGIGKKWPQGSINIELSDLKAGVALQRVDAEIALPPGKSQLALISVQARDSEARTHRLNAEVRYRPERIAAHFSKLVLTMPDRVWRLVSPSEVVQNAGEISIERFVLASHDQQVALDGTVSTGRQDLRLQVQRFDLTALAPLLPEEPKLAGILSTQLKIEGTAAAPLITGMAEVNGLKVGNQDFEGLETRFDYRGQRATLNLTFRQDRTHALTTAGSLPLALSWAKGWQTRVLGDMDVHVHSSGLDLAFLNTLAGEAVDDVQGTLTVDLKLTGPVSRPLPSGTIGLRGGQATVGALGVQISAMTLEAAVTPQQLRIQQFFAKARDGEIQGRGTIALKDYAPETLTVSLVANRWPAIWTRQYRAEIDTQINAKGPLTAPEVNGRIEVHRARLQPDLAFLEDKPVKPRDESIIVVGGDGEAVRPVDKTKQAGEPVMKGALKNLALDLTLLIHRDTQVRHPNAKLDLAGEVRARKGRGDDPSLVGTIDVVHGWARFQGRRFEIDRGRVVFTGGQRINPRLDIVAQHKLPDYLVEAVVGGSVEEPSLELRSEPPLEQADILAVLLFGKPVSALERGERVDLQRQAVALTSGYAAATIGKSVSQALGLEELGIDLSELDFSGGRVGLDRYINPRARVSVSQDIAGKEGQEVSIEYQIAPGWEAHTSTTSSGNSGADIIWRKKY